MKVGDLVIRADDLVRESLGTGIVMKVAAQLNSLFYQVKWSRSPWDVYWYERSELKVISESR